MRYREIINSSRNTAIAILEKNKNFLHDTDHLLNVEKNILKINEGKRDLLVLRIAAHWHDTGRYDMDSEEKKPHQDLSIKNFLFWSEKVQLNKDLANKIVKIIRNHRHRRGFVRKLVGPEAIFWDADKLDIINVRRCKKILNNYKLNKNNEKSEYNHRDSMNFWKSINNDFREKLQTVKARKIFDNKFYLFKKFITQLSTNTFEDDVYDKP